jgi:6-phosphogluconolactonase/glucosamine-6-phosphate isomerase/deaminase
VPRITLTIPAINAARQKVFLIAGEDKSDAVQAVFGNGEGPAGMVDADVVLLDEGAASRLTR